MSTQSTKRPDGDPTLPRRASGCRRSSGRSAMALVFNGFQLGGLFLAIIIADEITQRGESTWYEGVQLLAIYAVLGLTFFFVHWPTAGRAARGLRQRARQPRPGGPR